MVRRGRGEVEDVMWKVGSGVFHGERERATHMKGLKRKSSSLSEF